MAAMDIQYKIIGGDETEYGPASLAELKDWIRDGRVAATTKVWRSDLSMWSPADRYTELHDELARLHATAAAAADRALPPAGFWMRLAAYVVDNIVLALIFLAVWSTVAGSQHWQMPVPPQTLTDASMQQFREQFNLWLDRALPVFYPIFMIYDVLLNGRYGATLGKMLVGAKITMVDGAPIGYNRALLRWLAARLSDFFFIGYLPIVLRPDKRALHDLLVGTKVVFKR
jgi:uncharacterized RDD family membrane protein YckC